MRFKNVVLSLAALACIAGGATARARYGYGRATAQGRRAQYPGGGKSPIGVLRGGGLEMPALVVSGSCFGCSGPICG